MATSLSALLNIKAKVDGQGAVAGLGSAIGGLQGKAAAASQGLQGLTKSAGLGGLSGAMGTLTPLLSAAGLIGMAKSSLDGANSMYILSQRTGVSVTTLAKFKKAVVGTGTDIDAVAKGIGKLSKGLLTAKDGTGPTAEALKVLGLKATDAKGQLKSADTVMLEIADKFKKMPDGVTKTALAIQLFGKAGADMIPMLNKGGAAIDALSVKMTDAFAKRANQYSTDLARLSGKVGAFGADLLIVLLPALEQVTASVTAGLDAFNKLPEPVRTVIGVIALAAVAFTALAPMISAVVSLVGGLVGFLAGGAGLAGAFSAVAAAVSGLVGVIGGALTVIAGFITWPVVLVAALVAAGVAIFVFRDQIGAFFNSVGELVQTLIKTIWDMGEPIRKFWVELWDGTMKVTAPFFEWLMKTAGAAFAWLFDTFYKVFAEPYVKAWKGLQAVGEVLIQGLRTGWAAFSGWIGGIFRAIGDTFRRFVVDPLTGAWRFIVDTGKAAMKGLLSFAVGIVNGVIKAINAAINAINVVRKALGQSTLNQMGLLSVPRFAEGGFVTGPTLAMVGDNPGGREYVIPEGKAAGFAANYLGGARGAAAIPTTSSGATGGGPAGPVQVNLTTGPIMQTADGQRSVSLEEVERLVRDGVGQTIRQLRTPAGRYAMGVR
jgi:hypothetical protein